MVKELLVVAVALVALVGAVVLIWRHARKRRKVPARDAPASLHPPGESRAPASSGVTVATPGGAMSLPNLNALLDDSPTVEVEDNPSTSVMVFENGAAVDEPTASRRLVIVKASGCTDPGLARSRNEDSILLLSEEQVFVVADGMGGHAGGDVASKTAVDAIETTFRRRQFPDATMQRDRRPKRARELVWAIQEANRRIREKARAKREYNEMGATVIGARFSERNQRAYIGHVGDSRCYRLRDGKLHLLTQDHTLAAYGVVGPLGSRVRRALGVSERVSVDLFVDKPLPGDRYLLCSDGLNKMLDDEAIRRIVAEGAGDIERAVRRLIDAANLAGGKDNVSVILVGVYPAEGKTEGYSLPAP